MQTVPPAWGNPFRICSGALTRAGVQLGQGIADPKGIPTIC
jgi:hypothetical protein